MLLQTKDDQLKFLKRLITPVIVLALLVLQGFGNLYAQGITITGSATDAASGEPLIGVNVIISGTTEGTITDLNGEFSITVSDQETILVFSYIGYSTQEITVGNNTEISVAMQEDIARLDEVIVVGYGTVKKSDLTGAVSTVKPEEITAYPSIGVTQALQGRAAGVSISANNGEPGSTYKVRIRGATSINSSSDPLYVVDGFPGIPSAALPPPEDIESIEVLKDASATSIYGSRGANGVIMITTKRGRAGRTMVDFSASWSLQKEINRLDLLNADQYAAYINDIPELAGAITPPYEDTDWQEQIFQNGGIQNYNLAVSGGNERVTYYTSGVFYNQKGIVINSRFKRYAITSNVDINATKWLRFGVNLFANRTSQDGVKTQEGSGGTTGSGVIASALQFMPTLGIYDADGNYTLKLLGDPHDNPYALAMERENEDIRDRLTSNIFAEIQILRDLSFRTNLGAFIFNRREGEYVPTTLNEGFNSGGNGEIETWKGTYIASENYLTYTNVFADRHDLTVMGGYSYQSFRDENWLAYGRGFITDANSYWDLDGGTDWESESSLTTSELSSFYGRINYKFMDRYLLTVNARYDGSSRFAKNNKWAFFPSMALAWNINQESFMQNIDPISMLKARFSYGQTGNQAIRPYQSLAKFGTVFSVVGGSIANAVRPTDVANENLTWETTTQMNIGVDVGVISNRIMLNFDYYSMLTSDLLFEVPLPEYSGYGSQLKNIGEVENKGFEILLLTRPLAGQLRWNLDFNLSRNVNTIKSLPDGNDIFYRGTPGHIVGTDDTQILREGEPVGMFWGFVYEGVYQEGDEFIPGGGFEEEAGGEKYQDNNGRDADGELTGQPDDGLNNDDKTIIGNPHPDFIWGWNNTLSYKGLELNLFFQGVQGNDMYSFTLQELDRLAGTSNATTEALNRWTTSNTNTNVPKANQGRSYKPSTRFLYDASYIRLKNISLGYNFSSSLIDRIGIRSLRVYISGQNLLTISDYPGFDPEVNYRSSGGTSSSAIRDSNRNMGLDYGSYPNAKTYTVGFNIGF
jgi:TonB-linked SusC/RagA family outer membrane protein